MTTADGLYLLVGDQAAPAPQPATATPQQSVSRTPQPPARTATRPARTVEQRRATATRPTNHTLLPIGTLVTALIGDETVLGAV